MKSLLRLISLIVVVMFIFSAMQDRLLAQKIKFSPCIKPLAFADSALTAAIQRYLTYVGDYEIPIIAIQTKGDTTHYFVSAFIWTNSIKKHPPTSIVSFINREALLYTGKGSIVQTAPSCYQYLLKKYSKLLHIDKLNMRDNLPPDKDRGFFYDPISADIMVSKDGLVTTRNAPFPFIKYE